MHESQRLKRCATQKQVQQPRTNTTPKNYNIEFHMLY